MPRSRLDSRSRPPCGIRPKKLPTARSHFKLLARPSMVQSGAKLGPSAAIRVLKEVLEGVLGGGTPNPSRRASIAGRKFEGLNLFKQWVLTSLYTQ